MKKIILIVALIITFQNNLLAENFNKFNLWLSENEHTQYLNLEENQVCKAEKKYSHLWYYNKCDKFQGSNNLNIKINNKQLSGTNIAYQSNPNRDSLIFYLWKYSYRDRGSHLKEFKPANSSYDFKFNLIEDKFIKKQMKIIGLLG